MPGPTYGPDPDGTSLTGYLHRSPEEEVPTHEAPGEETPGRATVVQRWLARLALVAAAAAMLVAPVVAGLRQSLVLVLVGLAGLGLTLAGVWWALTNKGLVRAWRLRPGRLAAAVEPGRPDAPAPSRTALMAAHQRPVRRRVD